MWQEIPHFKGYMALSLVLAVLVQLIGLVPAIIMKKIIDQQIPAGNLREIFWSVGLFVLIPVLMTGVNTFYKYLLAVIARKSGRALTLKAFTNVLQQELAYFAENASGELATFIRQETMKYVMFWLADLPQLVASFLTSIVIVLYVGQLHWLLAVLLLLYFPLAYFPSNHFGKMVGQLTGKIIQANAKMAQTITDSIRAIRLVKAYQLEKRQTEQLNNALTGAIQVWSKVAFLDNLTGLWITNFINQLLMGLIFSTAAVLVVQGQLTIGAIVIVLSYLAVFYANANNIMNTNYQFKKQLAEFAPLQALLDLENAETSGSLPLTDFQKIQFQNVSFHYDATRGNILQDFNLTIEKGQWLGLIGKSGAGKSTVFDLLLRFYQAQAGHVTIDGVALEQFDLTTLRQKMTLVSQNINLFPGTIRDNLLLADPNADTARLNAVLAQVELQDFIASLPVGLETPVGEEGSLLSGGQKQRLSLAQGLLRHSPLLLLDEVSSALDPHTASAIKTMVATLKEKDQLTILSISHDYTFLDACDQVYRIVDGRAVPDVM